MRDAVLIASMVTWVAARAVAMGGFAERAVKTEFDNSIAADAVLGIDDRKSGRVGDRPDPRRLARLHDRTVISAAGAGSEYLAIFWWGAYILFASLFLRCVPVCRPE